MSSESTPLIAAIEAGGTKFNCAIGTGPHDLRAETQFETRSPKLTLTDVLRWLSSMKAKHGPFQAIGIGSFGPVDLDPHSKMYGYITTTPKGGWQHTDLVGEMRTLYKVPVGFDTDVNAAALGEYLWGAGQECDPLVYITVGTGVGGGVLIHGEPLHGMLHPEIGHLHVPPPANSSAINPECQCPFHSSCVEGYVSGLSISKRWGIRAENLPPDHPAWEDMSDVLSHAIANLILTLSPQRIILGGGVMQQAQLFGLVRAKVVRVLNGYIQTPQIIQKIESYLTSPGLGNRSGVLGAMALGMRALESSNRRKAALASAG